MLGVLSLALALRLKPFQRLQPLPGRLPRQARTPFELLVHLTTPRKWNIEDHNVHIGEHFPIRMFLNRRLPLFGQGKYRRTSRLVSEVVAIYVGIGLRAQAELVTAPPCASAHSA
jgi:hypothetical protein